MTENWWQDYEKFERAKSEECKKWLDDRYPEWNNIYAYW